MHYITLISPNNWPLLFLMSFAFCSVTLCMKLVLCKTLLVCVFINFLDFFHFPTNYPNVLLNVQVILIGRGISVTFHDLYDAVFTFVAIHTYRCNTFQCNILGYPLISRGCSSVGACVSVVHACRNMLQRACCTLPCILQSIMTQI